MSKHSNSPNENCLAGMACPHCGDFGPFKIHVTQSGMAVVSDDGTEEFSGSTVTDWPDDAYCQCLACGHGGPVRQFGYEPTTMPPHDLAWIAEALGDLMDEEASNDAEDGLAYKLAKSLKAEAEEGSATSLRKLPPLKQAILDHAIGRAEGLLDIGRAEGLLDEASLTD
jgi:hypothetical protein